MSVIAVQNRKLGNSTQKEEQRRESRIRAVAGSQKRISLHSYFQQ